MKRSLIILNSFLIATAIILVVFSKYFPSNMLEVYTDTYYSPEKVSEVLGQDYPCEYLNIYEMFSNRENIAVYTGNLNIILRNKRVEDKETIINEYIHYNTNEEILNNNLRKQTIYIILDTDETSKQYMNSDTILRLLRASGIKSFVSVTYKDISDLLIKIIIILCLVQVLIVFIYLLKRIIFKTKITIKNYVELKNEVYLIDYLKDKKNTNWMLGCIWQLIVAFILLAILIVLFVVLINIRTSFSLNPTSYTSIKATIMIFVNLISHYIKYGFTSIAFAILGIFFTYLLLAITVIRMFLKGYWEKRYEKTC